MRSTASHARADERSPSDGGVGDVVDDAKQAAERAASSRQAGWAARAGLTARGVVYLLLGVLALLVARGDNAAVDQKGALKAILSQPFGGILVALLALGFLCYALWRLSEAVLGAEGTGGKAGPRVQSAARALAYLLLTYTAVSLLLGSRQSQSSQQRGIVASLLEHQAGMWVVVLAGAGFAAVGLFQIYEGISLRFMRWFRAGALDERSRTVVRHLGRVGTIARGAVFTVAGTLIAVAGWKHDPSQAGGFDAAIKALRDQPYGGWLLLTAGLGLLAFGVFGLAEARYRRV
jgi:hypothetical protein